MPDTLVDYLAKFAVTDGEYTHILHEPEGKYKIPDGELGNFHQEYAKAVSKGLGYYITEYYPGYGPVVLDVNFIQDNATRQYTREMIKKAILIYNDLLLDCLQVSRTQIVANVLEKVKPTPTETLDGNDVWTDRWSDGFQIVYPMVRVHSNIQSKMREDFIRIAAIEKLFDSLDPFRDPESKSGRTDEKNIAIILSQMITDLNEVSSVAMYGSTKKKRADVSLVTACYMPTLTGDLMPAYVDSDDALNRQTIKHICDLHMCSGHGPARVVATKLTDASTLRRSLLNKTDKLTFDEAVQLVDIISPKRGNNRVFLVSLGCWLCNLDHRLLETWKAYGKQTRNHMTRAEYEGHWASFGYTRYGISTLRYVAKLDNPDKYEKINAIAIKKLVNRAMDGSSWNIATYVAKKYGDRYKCASSKDNNWYKYCDHFWKETEQGVDLRVLLSTEVSNDFEQFAHDLQPDANAAEGYDRDSITAQQKKIKEIALKLRGQNLKAGVVKDCSDILHDENFYRNLDEDRYLIGFSNGVYDLESGEFRDGYPEDYISMTVGYDYLDRTKKQFKDIRDIRKVENEVISFLNAIQHNRVMRDYLITVMSTCLSGATSEESFYVFTGHGANGKSKLMELMKYTLGDLYKPLDVNVLITRRTSASNATPEMADKKGCRCCSLDEPPKGAEINTGIMKIICGNDEIMARALFKMPIYFKPQFKPFLLCNDLPKINADDRGTWRRIKVIPFLSTFYMPGETEAKSKKQKVLGSHEYAADPRLSDRIPGWRQVFMNMLIDAYHKYRANGVIHPPVVVQCTNEYRSVCDTISAFMEGEMLPMKGSKISLRDFQTAYNVWFRKYHTGPCQPLADIRAYLVSNFGRNYSDSTKIMNGWQLAGKGFDEGT